MPSRLLRDRSSSAVRFGSVGLAIALLLGVVASAPGDVAAGQLWTATLGPGGGYGTATFATGTTAAGVRTYRVGISVKRIRANTTHAVTIRRGTCAVIGRLVATLPSITTGSAGTAARNRPVTATQGRAIAAGLAGGHVAIRVGPRCGTLRLASPVPSPTPTPTPTPTPGLPLPPGLGVPVEVPGIGAVVVLAAEPWTNPQAPAAAGSVLVAIEIMGFGSFSELQPADFSVIDAAGGVHAALASGRTPRLPSHDVGSGTVRGWLTFELPATTATDVVLAWTTGGQAHRIPLRVEAPVPSPIWLALAPATGLDGASVTDAVGTTTGYVAVGWTGERTSAATQGTAWTSADGVTWQARALPPASAARVLAIAHGSTGRLVAVGTTTDTGGGRAAIWVSDDDGLTWLRVPSLPTDASPGGQWSDVTAFAGGFVVVGDIATDGNPGPHAAAMTSTNGLTWVRSSFVDGATMRYFAGVVSGGPGFIGWGGEGDTASLAAVLWTSSDGDRWTRSPGAPGFRNPDTGGATSRRMELVFGSQGEWFAIATASDDYGNPLAYSSTTGTAWSPLSVGAALRLFRPAAVVPVGDDWLVGGQARNEGTSAYEPVAWHERAGRWLPVTVAVPAADAGTAVGAIVAFATGPAGPIAIGNWVVDGPTPGQRGLVWRVVQP